MGKKGVVVLGVTGGIAAYKAADLVSKLKKANYDVHVILTEHGRKFVTETTFQSLSQNPVYLDMFNIPQWNTEHIALAKRADVFLIAPATANIIGKVCSGIADDLLSTTIMATKAPVVFAPAMNTNMYENPIVQRNIATLKQLGYLFIEPSEGRLACGDIGKGKMAEPQEILEYIEELLTVKDQGTPLKGKKVLVTAGPTREPLDPFRFITNYSSGKMGYAIAQEAKKMGADVILISGPTNISPPKGVKVIYIETANEMFEEVLKYYGDIDIVIKAAAVSDYRPKTYSDKKLKKQQEVNIELVKNPDILLELGKLKKHQVLVGFAAETNNLEEYAIEKLKSKNLDMIVVNEIGQKDSGFANDTNIIQIITNKGEKISYPKLEKRECAINILKKTIEFLETSS
ncbi:bifunctional phosphopantothenoylcysteine decarboxylase/phosphopantothenate--cysteine ligase CoaBC [Anaerobranca gottschalkii]|uniref:Coenzyme A biosynthesis bifunctional protein CoaBC n=1 Tax=Anaerobranca gottschalkii DSM 13577 TaxID=1120990 RepID=A0A1H9YX86_9FIRM|nr:bifunctional phosphopantothenoylcysteine decarboxylase/phosphopantothenate--cysteine ligase CoaBC [Anaerobranca gottschalkii]SES73770.1 phosphopantothenoylcysteine decarboxylase / phosphopantothenate--cysteine ligase [Anaerobranca gottschalkii DSM 13577]